MATYLTACFPSDCQSVSRGPWQVRARDSSTRRCTVIRSGVGYAP